MEQPSRAAAGYRLRDAEPGDFSRLWKIDQECFTPGIAYSQRELAYYVGMRGAFTIVAESARSSEAKSGRRKRSGEEDAPIVGFVVGQRQTRGVGHIVTIDVVAEVRRAGVGTLLMSECEARMRAAGCEAVYLETAVDNHAALRFYKRRGYSVARTIPRYYLDSVDALLMIKNL